MRVAAIPDANHTFNYWDAPLDARADPYKADVVIRPELNITMAPSYASRAGIGAIDTVADMTYFLGAINQQAAINNVYTVDQFDCNEIHYDADVNPVYCPNGMPDVAELYLVERVVKMGRTGLTKRSGVAGDLTWQAWSTNFAQAQLDLPGQDARVQRIVAGYMTVGDYENIRLVEHLVRVTFAVELTEAAYDREQQKFLKADEDADNDGLTNLEEWQTASPDGGLANLHAFAEAALDGHKPVPTGTTSAFAAEAISILTLGANACDCENFPCMDKGILAADPYPGLNESYPLFADVPWDMTANNTATVSPEGADIALGTNIKVEADVDAAKAYGFAGWGAPGTLLDGSREMNDEFVLTSTGETTPSAVFGKTRMELPDDTSPIAGFTIAATPPENGYEEAASGGRFVYSPPHGTVTLKATSTNRLYEIYGWECRGSSSGGAPRYTYENPATLPVAEFATPLPRLVDTEPVPTTPVSLRASEGGTVRGSQACAWGGSFEGTVVLPTSGFLSLSAVPELGYEFDDWDTAALVGSGPSPAYVNLAAVSGASARFRRKEEFVLTVGRKLAGEDQRGPSGGGTVVCAGAVTDVNPARKYYASGIPVTVTATASQGYLLAGWEVDAENAKDSDIFNVPIPNGVHEASLQVTMLHSCTVTAIFKEDPLRVTEMSFTGNGNVGLSWSGPSDSFDYGWGGDLFGDNGHGINTPHWKSPSLNKPVALVSGCLPTNQAPNLSVKLEGQFRTCYGGKLRATLDVDGTRLIYETVVGSPDGHINGAGNYVLTAPTGGPMPSEVKTLEGKVSVTWEVMPRLIETPSVYAGYYTPVQECKFDLAFLLYGPPGTDTSGFVDEDGSNYVLSSSLTVKRLAFLMEGQQGSNSKNIADTLASKILAKKIQLGTSGIILWGILDNGIMDCASSKTLAGLGLHMMGIPRGWIQTRQEAEGCAAFLSTDQVTPPLFFPYNSDCTGMEGPPFCPGYLSETIFVNGEPFPVEVPCPIMPDIAPHPLHPGNDQVGVPYNPTIHLSWHLGCLAGDRENFFKIWDKTTPDMRPATPEENYEGTWYYISVVDHYGPFEGSNVLGTPRDKEGRYRIMKKWNPDPWWWLGPNALSTGRWRESKPRAMP